MNVDTWIDMRDTRDQHVHACIADDECCQDWENTAFLVGEMC